MHTTFDMLLPPARVQDSITQLYRLRYGSMIKLGIAATTHFHTFLQACESFVSVV